MTLWQGPEEPQAGGHGWIRTSPTLWGQSVVEGMIGVGVAQGGSSKDFLEEDMSKVGFEECTVHKAKQTAF